MSLKNLNKDQRAAVEAVEGPVLIFAGAGSGKTRVITEKISYAIREGYFQPEDILALTFTNKAADEMRKRVGKTLRSSTESITIGTFHSICARLLRKEVRRLGFTPDFAIYDVKDQITLLKIIQDDLHIAKDILTPQSARHQISLLKNKMIGPEEAQNTMKSIVEKNLAQVYASYQKALKSNNAMDFDDLLLFPLALFDKVPSLLKKYQKQWQYILVDEYQDTNRPQFQFLYRLAEKHKQICVVGDDDQSIYGWRGADIRNILDFEKSFPGCHIFKLEKNYRSTQQILNAAMAVVVNNKDRTPKTLVAANGKGEAIGLIETIDEMEEADAVISALEKEVKLNKRTFNDFVVMYRTNAQSRALEDSFRRTGIPYNIIGGLRFYDRKEVKDLLAYLRLIVNLKDTISLRRVVNFPPRGIGSKTIQKCVQQAEKSRKDLFNILVDPSKMGIRGKQAESLITFHSIIKKYHDLQPKLSANELVRTLVDETGIIKYYKQSDNPEDRERMANVQELVNSVDDFAQRHPDSTLNEFLEEVSLLTDIDRWNDQVNRVTLMTCHAAKGLEFPVVFITGLDDGLFPLYNSLSDRKELEEERRVFYVGLTRAMKKAYLFYATRRRRMGVENGYGLASRFIREIPQDYMENISFSSALTRKVVSTGEGSTVTEVVRTVTDFDDFKVGDMVEHAIFGVGKIMALSGKGENQRVGVVFKDGLKKKLIVRYAKLKKIDSFPN